MVALLSMTAAELEAMSKDDLSAAEWMARGLIVAAANGNSGCAQQVLDRTEGKVLDRVQHDVSGTIDALFTNATDEELKQIVRRGYEQIEADEQRTPAVATED